VKSEDLTLSFLADEMIEARRAYGGIRDDLNPLLASRRIQRQSSGGGGFFLGW
jgi:hypothetical protein